MKLYLHQLTLLPDGPHGLLIALPGQSRLLNVVLGFLPVWVLPAHSDPIFILLYLLLVFSPLECKPPAESGPWYLTTLPAVPLSSAGSRCHGGGARCRPCCCHCHTATSCQRLPGIPLRSLTEMYLASQLTLDI